MTRMSSKSASSPARRALRSGYVVAVLATGGALALRVLLESLLVEKAPMLLFTLAVMVSGWWGGLRPGLLATALGTAAAVFFLLGPRFSFAVDDARDLTQVAIFLVIGGSISTLCEMLHDQRSKISVLTEQRRLQEAMENSERRLRRLVDANIVGVAFSDRHGRFLDSNDEFLRIVGYDRDDLCTGKIHWIEMTPERYRPLDEQGIAEAEARGASTPYEKELVRKDGTRVPILLGYARVEEPQHRYVCFVLDISERKKLETDLRVLADIGTDLIELVDFESTLQRVVARIVPAIADWCAVDVIDGDSPPRRAAFIHADPSRVGAAWELAEKYRPLRGDSFGVGRVLCTGESELVEDVTDPSAIARDDRHLELLRTLGLRSSICVPLRLKGQLHGAIQLATTECGRRFDAGDLQVAEDIARRVAVARDNARLYWSLQEADRRKDEFLATLAHELRNPLAPIRNAVQLLRMKDAPSPEMQWARDVIDRQLGQMVRLVDDLMDVSRITRNKLGLRKERVDLERVLRGAVETSRPLIAAAGHSLVVVVPPGPIVLEADMTRLAQVFSNVLNNAAKYTPRNGTIRVTVVRHEANVTVTIRDNGVGIPQEMLPRIFDMFAQVDRTLERSQGGLGIGLTLVRRLVELHGGTVEARSDGPNRGSEFVIRLPIVETDPPQAPPSAGAETRPRVGRRVVIADDNQDNVTTMALLLQAMGHEVHTADNGLEAVALTARLQPDVVLLDIGMPKMNGYDAARRIRKTTCGQRVVLVAVTGWGQESDRRRTQEAGFDHHLVKPVDIVALQAILVEENVPRTEQ